MSSSTHSAIFANLSDNPRHTGEQKQTYRACGIPVCYDIDSLYVVIFTALQCQDTHELTIHSLACDFFNNECRTSRTATLSFSFKPSTLSGNFSNWTIQIPVELGSKELVSIYMDILFLGFTPLSPAEFSHQQNIDCVSIHGWGGHALGSFRDTHSHYVWLRDGLTKQFPKLRIWIYGYRSDLKAENTYGNIHEYASNFRRLLMIMRKRSGDMDLTTPLIFIAHSLGGLLLKEAFIGMHANDEFEQSLLRMTGGVLFFGVPSQGMNTESLAAMVGGKPQRLTLEMLNQTGNYIERERQHRKFCEAFSSKTSRLVCFYEVVATPTIQENPDTKEWTRDGKRVLLVTQASATRGREWDNLERDTISIEADHKGIVKFSPNDSVEYPKVASVLSDIIHRCEDVVETNSRQAQNPPIGKGSPLGLFMLNSHRPQTQ
jgi:hypothetical protein